MSKRVVEVEKEVKDFAELKADIQQQIEDLKELREETINKIKENSNAEFKKIIKLTKEIKKDFRDYESESALQQREIEALGKYICDVLKKSKKGFYIDFIYKGKFKSYNDEERFEEKDISISKRGFYTKDNWREKRTRVWENQFESNRSCFASEDFCNQLLEKTPSNNKNEMKKVIKYMNLIAKKNRGNSNDKDMITEMILPEKVVVKGMNPLGNTDYFDFDESDDKEFEVELDKIYCNGSTINLSPKEDYYRRNLITIYETIDEYKDFLAINKVKKELEIVLLEHSKKINKLLKKVRKEKEFFKKTLEPYLLLGDDIL